MGIRMAGLAAVLAAFPLMLSPHAMGGTASALAGVRSWTYQLQGIDLRVLAATDYDLVVIDYSRDGTAAGAFSASEIATLKTKPDGSQRFVLSYLSIGEAEDYRFYWQNDWARNRPSWLFGENPEWEGNYNIRYWDPAWQATIFGQPTSYLDRIVAAGFDGVYLDRVDAFERDDPQLGAAARKAAMTAFVNSLAAYARAGRPRFLVVPQNGEELLSDPSYRSAIDGLAKEDLLFGAQEDQQPNSLGMLRSSLRLISRLTAEGKPVFLAEYLNSASDIAQVRHNAETLGVVLFIGDRELDDAHSR
ncbi:MJ1477/TM1410 family putative glycoside hydrolase [Pelagibacterium nitratireducens]|uniref:MJ1477/TM1410 family putative glycoside hydrolase n=1 Tax=Pelagibacterium nitratireducens TaxID=1046114 RepID=A0ABZ2I542_9HYPH